MRNPPMTWSITSLVNEERDVVHRLYEEAFPGQDSALDTLGDMAEVLVARHLPGDDLVVVDPAKLLDSDRLEDYYGHAGFRLASTGEMQARVVEVSAALAEA
jgi:hypothetical protein